MDEFDSINNTLNTSENHSEGQGQLDALAQQQSASPASGTAAPSEAPQVTQAAQAAQVAQAAQAPQVTQVTQDTRAAQPTQETTVPPTANTGFAASVPQPSTTPQMPMSTVDGAAHSAAPSAAQTFPQTAVKKSRKRRASRSERTERAEKAPRRRGTLKVAGLLAAVIVLGAGAGFGGAYVARSMMNKPSVSSSSQKPAAANTTEGTPTLDELQQDISSPQSNVTMEIEFNSDGSYRYTRDLVKAVQDSIVYIETTASQNGMVTAKYGASGVIISTDGYIITNAHVVSGKDVSGVKVNTTNPETGEITSEVYEAKVCGSDTDTDLAVLKIEASGLHAAKLGDSDKLSLGDDVVAIGNPLFLENSVTKGIISGLNREVSATGRGLNSIQTDTPLNGGNSGGALFNGYGEVIGIVDFKKVANNAENVGFAISINEAKAVINDLIEKGYVTGRAWLGISYIPVTEAYYQSGPAGWQVAKIDPNLPISESELVVGDTIVSVDGVSVFDSSIDKLFLQKKPGDTITLTVVRYDSFGRSKNVDIPVVLGEYTGQQN